jgi:hypothetical protein
MPADSTPLGASAHPAERYIIEHRTLGRYIGYARDTVSGAMRPSFHATLARTDQRVKCWAQKSDALRELGRIQSAAKGAFIVPLVDR